jgi:hypothetical protein
LAVRVPLLSNTYKCKNRQLVTIEPVAQRWLWWSVLLGHHSPNGAPLMPTHHPTKMNNSTIQVVINGNQVQGQIDEIAKILGMVSNTMAQPISSTLDEELLPFNKFAIRELSPHLGEELATQVVGKLEKCARSFYPDFRNFIGMYNKVGSIEQRQLLKTLSAIYRFKFGRYMNESAKYSLKSEIKYATICPHCGAIANAFVVRLTKEGLW